MHYMDLPPLVISSRDREFKHYRREQREDVVISFLFEGLSSRKLDEKILGLDSRKSKGYQSWAILRHYGLTDDFKGIFKGMSYKDVIDQMPGDSQYNTIYDIVSEVYEETTLESYEFIRGFTKTRLVKTRVNQNKFRKIVLEAYGGACCITGISIPYLIRASHIKPWAYSNEIEKTDVHNGLCLNSLHDAAFDAGIITIEPSDYSVKLSSGIEEHMPTEIYENYFRKYDGVPIHLPNKDKYPKTEYLEYHKYHIFNKNKQYLEIEDTIPI